MSDRTFKITDGPRAEVIWDHAKLAFEKGVKIPVKFTTDIHLNGNFVSGFKIIQPVITAVGHEDGSGLLLLISGYINHKPFHGFYNARSRTGTITMGVRP
jgi:hypothetical protein